MYNMQILYLAMNEIGNPGITALADALGKGALASLKMLVLEDTVRLYHNLIVIQTL